MNVFIRTDASAATGSGHLMRCLALANELRRRCHDVAFVTRATQEPWGDLLNAQGHPVVTLAEDFPGWAADARETSEALRGAKSCDWLIVDHYELARGWEEALRPHAAKILAIDDLGRAHACDALLDQNILGNLRAYDECVPPRCLRLLGPYYALLRPEFGAARRRQERGCDEACRRVLINFGGSDPTAETATAIEAFLRADLGAAARAQIVLGKANAAAAELHRRYDGDARLEIIDQSDRMAELMAGADIAIGAGGSSTWERACLGLPTLVVAVAANQEAIAEELARRGGHCYLGRSGEVDGALLAAGLRFLAGNAGLRTAFSSASAALCDGEGVRRVADRLVGATAILLRRATPADAAALYAWRNAEAVRRFSGDPTPIARAEHERWLARALHDADRHLLIGEDEAGPVGVVRFDVAGDQADISIYLVPQRIGAGLGASLLAAAEEWLAAQLPALREVRARVLAQNPRSVALFEHAGYRPFDCGYRKPLHAPGDPA